MNSVLTLGGSMPAGKKTRNKMASSAKRGDNQKRRWVAKVTTDSTHPPAGLFTRSAATIARALASPRVSPKGPGSGMRMLTYFINRAGRGLSRSRRAELEKAKSLLAKRVHRETDQRKRKAA
jgi:tRNA(adenine34) deaminase